LLQTTISSHGSQLDEYVERRDARDAEMTRNEEKTVRAAVVCDFAEEGWPSMELVADMLLSHLRSDHLDTVDATRIQPAMRMRFAKPATHTTNGNSNSAALSANGNVQPGVLFNIDRVLNRFLDYPRHLRPLTTQFDLFHLIDHSYGQVIHELPPERTVVTCHDLDTFQCLLNPEAEPRSIAFKKMMSRTLSGFRKAARVICVSEATRNELLKYGLTDRDRTVVIANGVHEACSPDPDPDADAELDRLLGSTDAIDILHVGSTIRRKRIDILLRVFARLKQQFPKARLLRVGGKLTAEQSALMHELGVAESVVQLPQLDRRILVAAYRRAALVLLPSEREGFGLPIVEAMACGTPVVASDLPPLREVGGDAVTYCRTADVESWVETIAALLREKKEQTDAWAQRRSDGIEQAANFTWSECATKTIEVYRSVLSDAR
jgi:glycosyltransferase involved in cell wall biosynthesis